MTDTTTKRPTRTRKPKAEAKAPESPAPEAETQPTEGEAKPESTRISAATVEGQVYEAIQAAGEDGITLKDLEETTGLRYRVLHNVTWRLEGGPSKDGSTRKYPDNVKVQRVGAGRTVRYASL